MKALLGLFVLGFMSQGFAADKDYSISCESQKRGRDDVEITVTAKTIVLVKQNEAAMWQVVATARNSSDDAIETGRIDSIDADEKYKPRKYKNHSRFDLSKLTNTETFGSFLPMDSCTLNFLVPNNALSKETFTAPVIVNCDQGGGTVSLECTVTERE